jgi:hypothetical protein
VHITALPTGQFKEQRFGIPIPPVSGSCSRSPDGIKAVRRLARKLKKQPGQSIFAILLILSQERHT